MRMMIGMTNGEIKTETFVLAKRNNHIMLLVILVNLIFGFLFLYFGKLYNNFEIFGLGVMLCSGAGMGLSIYFESKREKRIIYGTIDGRKYDLISKDGRYIFRWKEKY